MSSNINKWIDKAFDYANANSDDDDIIYKSIFKYKALRNLPEEDIDAIYSEIANRMGYGGNYENSYY